MKTSSAKQKGRRCSMEVRTKMLEWARDLKPDDILVTSSGVTGEDLVMSPAAREIYPYVTECKNVEKINIWDANKQAIQHWIKRGAKSSEYPIVFYKRNRTEIYVSIRLDDFLKLTR